MSRRAGIDLRYRKLLGSASLGEAGLFPTGRKTEWFSLAIDAFLFLSPAATLREGFGER